ncbi:MAG: hypothetical protein WBB85_15230 [Albidovulum sp.]|uniref:hypothetical protein n=1 Tax=Albidovulum sp. TaxID=1872424 RepID=UPI003C8C7E51
MRVLEQSDEHLILDRAAGTVELRRRNLRRVHRDVFSVNELAQDGIMVQADEGAYLIALKLISRSDPLPMRSYYQSGRTVRAGAEAARKWLASDPLKA